MTLPPVAGTARGVLPWAPRLIYKALTDYDTWHEWLPLLTSSKLLTREDVLAIAEIGFAGRSLMLECVQTPDKGILARVIDGKGPIREIQWTIEAGGEDRSNVTVALKRTLGSHLLAPASWPGMSPATYLTALHSWLSSAHPGPEVVKDGENLFELWETEAGLVCWVKGRKYKLTPVGDGK